MNSNQICRLVNRIPEISHFSGALPIDLVERSGNPQRIIVNLDSSAEEGSHWVALDVVDSYGRAHYFDSLAGPIPAELLERFRIVSRSTRAVQHLFSSACGYYCILFLFLRSKGYGMRFIQEHMKRLTDKELRKIVVGLSRK